MNPKPQVKRPLSKRTVLGAAALLVLAAHGASQVPDTTVVTNEPPAPQIATNAPVKVVQPAQIELPAGLADVVRLAESGADEAVIVAYIEKSPGYHITSDQIIYLQDLGISQPIIRALVQHGTSAGEVTVAPVPEPTPVQTPAVAPVPEPEPVPEAAATTATGTTVNYFYQSLSPYGSWVDVAPYGLCWQPSVVVVNPYWRPYCDNGYWLWSDCGWYWRSYYTWGWAPFHYGRWFHHAHRGWIWWPDRVWGPSWVTWRNAPGYCGWAPLPPRSHFSAGIGWTYNGVAVGFNYSFGLGPSHYTFVQPTHFMDRRVGAHALPPRQVNTAFNNTTVINNYVAGSNNRIVNQGIDRRQVERATRAPLREVQVRELPQQPSRFTAPDQVTRVGNADVVYRPSPRSTVAPAPRIPRVTTPSRPAPGRPSAVTPGQPPTATPSRPPTTPPGRPPGATPGRPPSAVPGPAPAPTRPSQAPRSPRSTSPRSALETRPAERLMPGTGGRPPLVPTLPSRPQQPRYGVQPRAAPSFQPRAPTMQPRSLPQQRAPAMQPRFAPSQPIQRAPQSPRSAPRGAPPRSSSAPITD